MYGRGSAKAHAAAFPEGFSKDEGPQPSVGSAGDAKKEALELAVGTLLEALPGQFFEMVGGYMSRPQRSTLQKETGAASPRRRLRTTKASRESGLHGIAAVSRPAGR